MKIPTANNGILLLSKPLFLSPLAERGDSNKKEGSSIMGMLEPFVFQNLRLSVATAFAAALPGRLFVFRFAIATATTFFASVMHGVDCRPGTPLSLIL
jgi:hypothetical protein